MIPVRLTPLPDNCSRALAEALIKASIKDLAVSARVQAMRVSALPGATEEHRRELLQLHKRLVDEMRRDAQAWLDEEFGPAERYQGGSPNGR